VVTPFAVEIKERMRNLFGHVNRRNDEEWQGWRTRRRLAALDYERRHALHRDSRRYVSQTYNVRQRFDKITAHVIRYWQRKNNDPAYHRGAWGGHRWAKLTDVEELHVRSRLWLAVKQLKKAPMIKLSRMASRYVTHSRQALNPNAPDVVLCVPYVRRIFAGWGWTWKVPVRCQIAKFSPQNIGIYIHYTIAVSHLPWDRIKFMDEAHLDHRGTSRIIYCESSLFL
jgi:hypothetical protein